MAATAKMALEFATIMCLFVSSLAENMSPYGIMAVRTVNGSSKSSTFCITYNPRFHDVPEKEESAMSMNLVDLLGSEDEYLCDVQSSSSLPSVNGSAVAVKRGNCTYAQKAANVKAFGGSAILIVTASGLHEPLANSSDYDNIKIVVSMILAVDFDSVKAVGENLTVKFYAPFLKSYDVNMLFIWLTAFLTVVLGSFWSGHVRHQLWLKKVGLESATSQRWHVSEEDAKADVQYSPKIIIFIVIIMCAMLLGLYFFYDYLVYVIIVLFALASSAALYSCLWLLMVSFLPTFASCRIPANRLYYLRTRPEVRDLLLMCLCLSIGIWWLIERNKSYAWMLQDILGVAFCIHMMKKIRLSSLKVCSILLILLFFYDIFFVFITPLFTKNGASVMIDIATGRGGTSGEKIPVVLLFPKMSLDDFATCFSPFSLLGFGDILIPGLLVSFCYGFDLQVNSRGVYFIATVIAYGLGLGLTFVALALMKQGQPALLYLVPCTLITVFVLALVRKEFIQIWTGTPKLCKRSPDESEDVSLTRSDVNSPQSHPARVIVDNADLDYSSAGEEDRMLGQK